MASQLLQFPFTAGLDEDTDPKTAPPGRLTTAVNVEWTKEGHLETRAGTAQLASTGLSVIRRIIVRGAELCVTDGQTLYSYSPTQRAWTNVGAVGEASISWFAAAAPLRGIQSSDSAYLSDGRVVQAWSTGDPTNPSGTATPYVQVFDKTTQQRSTVPKLVTANYVAKSIKVVANAARYWTLMVSSGGQLVSVADDNTETALRTDALQAPFDARVIANSLFVAYQSNVANACKIKVYKYSLASTPVEQANTTVGNEIGSNTGTASFSGISIDGAAGESVYVGYVGNSNIAATGNRAMVACFDTSLAATQQRTIVDQFDANARTYRNVGLCRFDASHCAYVYTATSLVASNTEAGTGVVVSHLVSNTGSVSADRATVGQWAVTRPMVANVDGTSRIYGFTVDAGRALINVTEITTYLMEYASVSANASSKYPARHAGVLNPLFGSTWMDGHLSSPATNDLRGLVAIVPYQAQVAPQQSGWLTATQVVDVNFGANAATDLWRGAEMMNETHIAGGQYAVYDGRRTFGHGFARSFFDGGLTSFGSNGSMSNGTYIYSVVSVYQSFAGVAYRSPAAVQANAGTVTGGPTGSIRIRIVPQTEWKTTAALADANEPSDVVHELYRTQANGTVLHKLTIEPSTAVVVNSPLAAYQEFWDLKDEANIDGQGTLLAARPVLYNLGELDDYAPVASLTTRVHKNRLWVLAGDKRTLWVSKDFTTNLGTAPGFHPTQVIPFDEDVIGIESMDDKLLVFSGKSVWYVVGDGPSPNGDGGFDVVRLQSDTGLVTARSLCSGPMGVVYQSPRGIYLMDRGFQQTWIGKPVRDQLAAYPTVTSAVLVPAKNQLRISCNNAAGTAGVVLVFDYARGQWTTFQYAGTPAIADAALVNGVYTFATAGGAVYQEDTTTYLDAGTTFVGWDVESAWVSQDGPLGYERVRKVAFRGDRYTSADVRFRIAVNDSASYAQDRTFTSDVIDALADTHVLGVTAKVQKCRAFRFRLTSTTPTNGGAVGNGRGITLSAVGFEIVPKGEMDRRAPAATG